MSIPLSEITNNCLIATAKVLILCLGGVYLSKKGVILELIIFSYIYRSWLRKRFEVCRRLLRMCLFLLWCLQILSQLALNSWYPTSLLSFCQDVIIGFLFQSLILQVIIFVGVFFGRLMHKYVVKNSNYAVMIPLAYGFVHTLNIQLSMSETLGDLLDKIVETSNMQYQLNSKSR